MGELSEERIKIGKDKLKTAIEAKDVLAFVGCFDVFRKNNRLTAIGDVLKTAPIEFMHRAGVELPVYSERLGRHVVFGRDIRWDTLSDIGRFPDIEGRQLFWDIIAPSLAEKAEAAQEVVGAAAGKLF